MRPNALDDDDDIRTNANNYISAGFIGASVAGSIIGSLLLSHHIFILNLTGVVCAVLAVGVAAMFLPPDLGCERDPECPSNESEVSLLDGDASSDVDSTLINRNSHKDTPSVPRILLASWKSSIMSLLTLFRVANPTFTALWIFFFYAFSTIVEILNPQYISLSLHWPLARVNALLAIKTLVSAALLIALPSVRKRLLEPFMDSQAIDLLIIEASIALNMIGMAGYGFQLPAPFFTAALCIYTAGNGVQDSLLTFGRSTLPTTEDPADLFVRAGLIQLIAGLLGSFFWTALFSLCLRSSFLPIGLPFWLCAGFLAVAFGLVRSLKGQAVYRSVS